MPFIHTRVNVPLSKESEQLIKKRYGKAIQLLPGKSESWLMLQFDEKCRMWFKGIDSEPVAYVEVKLFGRGNNAAYSRLTETITQILHEELNIEPDHVYIKYEETAYWGWNGSNF